MKDWLDAFTEKLSMESFPLPDGELELLERRIKCRKRIKTAWYCSAALAGITIVLALISNFNKVQDTGPEIIAYDVKDDFPPEVSDTTSFSLNAPLISQHIERGTNILSTPEEGTSEVVVTTEEVEYQGNADTLVVTVPTDERVPTVESAPIVPEVKKSGLSDRIIISFGAKGSSSLGKGEIRDYLQLSGDESELYQHNFPKSLGITFAYRITEHFNIVSGLDYSYCSSTISKGFINNVVVLQQAHYLGIPLHLDFVILEKSKTSLYVGTGIEAWRCLYAKKGLERIKDNQVYLSAIGLAGLRYEPIRNVGLFIEPQYSRLFLTDTPAIKTAITDKKDLFTVTVGVSFRID